MPKKRLTELTIQSARAPQHGQVMYRDTQLPGLCLRVSQGGKKTFYVVHGRQRTYVTIGPYPLIPLAAARKRAREILLGAALNPRKTISLSYPEALDRYLKLREPELRPSTFLEHRRLLQIHSSWDAAIEDISVDDVLNALDAIPAPSEKRHAYSALKMFFSWCVAREYCEKNPLAAIPKPKASPPRERVLDEEEIRRLWNATQDDGRHSLIVRLLLLTAQRANQIASLHESWIDYSAKVINFPASIMKSNRAHTIPFGPLIEFHLRKALPVEGYLFSSPGSVGQPFSGWSKSKKRLDVVCRIDPWTIHDLRRTWATQSAQLDTDPHVIERVLAHTTGSISKIAAIYNRYKYQDQMRAAVIRYENHIVQLCASM